MHIAKGSARTALHMQSLPPEVRHYIAELEREVDRLQRRSKAHRQNLRSMHAKLVGVNLRQELRSLMQPQPLRAAR